MEWRWTNFRGVSDFLPANHNITCMAWSLTNWFSPQIEGVDDRRQFRRTVVILNSPITWTGWLKLKCWLSLLEKKVSNEVMHFAPLWDGADANIIILFRYFISPSSTPGTSYQNLGLWLSSLVVSKRRLTQSDYLKPTVLHTQWPLAMYFFEGKSLRSETGYIEYISLT